MSKVLKCECGEARVEDSFCGRCGSPPGICETEERYDSHGTTCKHNWTVHEECPLCKDERITELEADNAERKKIIEFCRDRIEELETGLIESTGKMRLAWKDLNDIKPQISALMAQNERLKSRGIEDMQDRIAELEAYIHKLRLAKDEL